MTLRTLLRLASAAGLVLGIAASASAQPRPGDVRVQTSPFETLTDARFRSYPTQIKETQLLLDTVTGQLWQVQLREPFPYMTSGSSRKAISPGRYKLTDPQENNGVDRRFSLLQHDTQNFSLLDQKNGTVWQIVLFYDNPASTTVTRLEDMPLPQVETP